MALTFNPRTSTNPKLINDLMLGVSPDGHALTQRDKEKHSIFTRLYHKIMHWRRNENERIESVTKVFNEIVTNCDPMHEDKKNVANLYANCSYFNERVIKRHNSSWIAFFFRCNNLQLINVEKLKADLEEKVKFCKDGLTLEGLTNKNVAAVLNDTKQLLEGIQPATKAGGLALVTDVETLYKQKSAALDKEGAEKASELNKKVLVAQPADVGALKIEANNLLEEVHAQTNKDMLNAIIQKLELIEKMHQLSIYWQKAKDAAIVVTDEMRANLKQAVEAVTVLTDMVAHPLVAAVQKEAQAVFAQVEKHAQGYAMWVRAFEVRTQVLLQSALTDPTKMISTFAESAEFKAFVAGLPAVDSEEKKLLLQKAQDFEALVAAVVPYQQAVAKVVEFGNKLKAGDYKFALTDFAALEDLQKGYADGLFKKAFKSTLESVKQTLSNSAQAEITKLVGAVKALEDLAASNLQDFIGKTDQVPLLKNALAEFVKVFKDDPNLANAVKGLGNLSNIIDNYPAFKTADEKLKKKLDEHCKAHEGAVETLGAKLPAQPLEKAPALVSILGAEHPAIRSHNEARETLKNVQAFTELTRQYHTIASGSDEKKIANVVEQINGMIPNVKAALPGIVKKYQERLPKPAAA